MTEHYVRMYDPVADVEDWAGPLSAHMAGLVAMGLEGKVQTRVYHKSELSDAPGQLTAAERFQVGIIAQHEAFDRGWWDDEEPCQHCTCIGFHTKDCPAEQPVDNDTWERIDDAIAQVVSTQWNILFPNIVAALSIAVATALRERKQ